MSQKQFTPAYAEVLFLEPASPTVQIIAMIDQIMQSHGDKLEQCERTAIADWFVGTYGTPRPK